MRHEKYIEALRAAGHLLQLDDDGNVDMFAMSYEFHNGPMCELCHGSWCEHCQEPIEPCPAAAIESTCEVIKEDSAAMLLPDNAGGQATGEALCDRSPAP